MDAELRELTRRAAGPPAGPPDLEHVARRAADRRRTRRLATFAAAVVVLVAGAVAWQTLGPVPRPDIVGSGVAAVELVGFDPTRDVVAGVPSLDEQQVARQPTRMPPGWVRCDGPDAGAGRLEVTVFCRGERQLVLRSGPHGPLHETGEQLPVGPRTGWFEPLSDGGWRLTVSDRTAPNDRHYQLDAPAELGPPSLAAIVESIPAFAEVTARGS